MIVTNLNWMFLIVCVLRESMQPLKYFFSILDKHAPKKIKTYDRIKNSILIRTFGSKQ